MKKVLNLLPALALIGLIALIYLYFYPGFMSFDSMTQYQSALAGEFADNHPAIMSWIWHFLMLIVPGPQGMLYFHLLLLFTAVLLWQHNLSGFWPKFLLPFMFIAPWIINFAGVLWKDVGMAYSLLSATALLYNREKSIKLACCAIPFILYACAVRYNAILAIVPLIFIFFLFHYSKLPFWKSSFFTIALSVVCFLTIPAVTYGLIHAEKRHYETLLMGDEIAKISAETQQNIMPWIKHEDLLSCTQPPILYERALCFIHRGYDESGSLVTKLPVEEVHKLWEQTVLNHPMAYLNVRIEAFLYFLRSPSLEPVYFWFPGIMENSLGIKLKHPERADDLGKYVTSSTQTIIVSEFFKPYLWLLLALALVALAFLLENRVARMQIIALNLSSLGCFSSLFIAVPSTDFRYIYWCVVATSLSLFVFISAWLHSRLSVENRDDVSTIKK